MRPEFGRLGRQTTITRLANRYVGYPDRRLAAEAAVGSLISRSTGRFLRKRQAPSLEDLASHARGVYTDACILLASIPWARSVFAIEKLTELTAEHQRLQDELEGRYTTRQLAFPRKWAVEAGSSFLLYALVRGLRPSVTVEMGVGNGQSSYYILRALQANGAGKLWSFDVLPQAGGLVSEEERGAWQFRLVDGRNTARSLVKHLAGLPRADLCLHDADHGYLAQYFEFGRLWAQLREDGVLVSDDADASYALIDFCRMIGHAPELLVDGRKAMSLLSRSSPSVSEWGATV